MKKNILVFLIGFAFVYPGLAQVNLLLQAPMNNGSTTQVRAPNGLSSAAYMRACALVLASELTGLPNGSTISNFGFTCTTGTSGVPVAGNFTVYLQNTADVTFTKSTTYATVITGMTPVFTSIMTIPLSAGTCSIFLSLGTPFPYTGGGLYVAYDWFSTGPFSTTPATYLSESAALNPGCASASSNLSAPTILTTTNFRPSFLFGAANTNTNDIQVVGLDAVGKVSAIYNAPQSIRATVFNASNIAKSNFNVTMDALGVNPYTNSQMVGTLAAGTSTTVTFSPFYNPQLIGLSTLSVSVAADQNNSNNSMTYAQVVNCNVIAKNPGTGPYIFNAVGFGAGSGIIGNLFLCPATCSISGLSMAISTNAAAVGNQVYGVLLSSAGVIMATTNTITLTAAMLGTFQQFDFPAPQTLFASTNYIFGGAQMVGTVAFYPAGTQASPYVSSTAYVTCPLGGGLLTPLTTNYGYFGIEAILTHTANVSIASTPTAICIGNSANIVASGPVNNYTWSTSSNASSITVSPAQTTTYSVVTTNTIGCVSSASVTLNVNSLPNIIISTASASVCVGSTLNLYAGGANTYTWDNGSNSSILTITPTVNTTYTLIGANLAGCINSNMTTITVDEPIFTVSSNTAICSGGSATLNATSFSPYTYIWSTGWSASQLIVSPLINTVYTVTATNSNFCSNSKTVSVNVNPNPTVTATAPTTVICRNESLTLSAIGANTYTWSDGSNGTSLVVPSGVLGNFSYSVTGVNSSGCSSSASITIKISACTGLSESLYKN